MALYLVDTNVLVYLANPRAPQHGASLAAIDILRKKGDALCVGPQNVVEFWCVATREARKGGLDWPASRVAAFYTLFLNNRLFYLLNEPSSLLASWYHICIGSSITGPECYDAKLAALMHEHRIGLVLTFNTTHFARIPNITAIDPSTIR